VWDALRTPFWVARIVGLVGAITLLSAISPALRNRAVIVYELVPDVFPAAATTGAAAVGVILIVLSRALRRGKHRAWLLATVLVAAVLVALAPAGGPHRLSDDEESRLRGLLSRWGAIDSLSYFALRDDRSVIFSSSGKSALTYRVIGTVSLAAGDPVGDPEA